MSPPIHSCALQLGIEYSCLLQDAQPADAPDKQANDQQPDEHQPGEHQPEEEAMEEAQPQIRVTADVGKVNAAAGKAQEAADEPVSDTDDEAEGETCCFSHCSACDLHRACSLLVTSVGDDSCQRIWVEHDLGF